MTPIRLCDRCKKVILDTYISLYGEHMFCCPTCVRLWKEENPIEVKNLCGKCGKEVDTRGYLCSKCKEKIFL